ncbi:Npun_R2821/Npun_R2822 family protein [cf. Phormidesmis sp. LEGE 11477]|uniref:Npun_R2821/Npun_R2822 family protein n=1 Tax=cf. Phormidesmis sp. LEGE 11477 TaxID=1828680 RepID=UPI001D13350D|nr:Npun_R2821/Npun_R2822 family protein [cf. Phormidesmis sp. LEGE 11477]
MRGVYIVASDRVADNAIALLSSLRLQDPDIPVFLIPFSEDASKVTQQLAELYNVQLFPDLALIEVLTQKISEIFPRDFLALPNKMRKLAAWFGPLDEFLYIDTDILFFSPVADTLAYLDRADFIWCDYHYKRGLEDVFSNVVLDQNIFSDQALKDVFNSGLWGSKKSALSLEALYQVLRECAAHREYFDFSSGTTDQPIMNYLVLKTIPNRLNIAKANPNEPGSWGGSPHFERRGHVLFDGERPLRYLHWAGTPMRAGGPYRDIWTYYRYLNDPEGAKRLSASDPINSSTPNAFTLVLPKLRQLKKTLKQQLRALIPN